MRRPLLLTLALSAALVGTAACTTQSGATTAPTQAAPPVTAAPAATETPATAAPATQAAAVTVKAEAVGAAGTILVDGTSGMTLYMFAKDVKDSGKSNCTGGCLDTWPALTVDAGETPTGGDGVTGALGMITRDGGALQVTYNGLPLYFFRNDKAPGDLNGVYENWETVKP